MKPPLRSISVTAIVISFLSYGIAQANSGDFKKEIHKLEGQISAVELMQHMLAVDVAIKNIPSCARSDKLKMAAIAEMKRLNKMPGLGQSEYNSRFDQQEKLQKKYLIKYKQCFAKNFQQVARKYEDVIKTGVSTYDAFESKYNEIKSPFYGNRRISNLDDELRYLKDKLLDIKKRDKNYVGIVASVFDAVYVKPDGISDWKRVEPEYVLMADEKLRTGSRGRARVELFNQNKDSGPTVVNIGPGSMINIRNFLPRGKISEQNIFKRILNVIRGKVQAFNKRWGGRGRFSVRTGTSLCRFGVADVEIEYMPGDDRIYYRVHKGKTLIKTPYEKFELHSGYQVSVIAGSRGEIRKLSAVNPL